VRDVLYLSTIHGDKMDDVPGSWSAHGRNKPMQVTDYKKHKIIVDKSSHLLVYNSFQRKSVE
jgi:hypothetical protein